MFVLSREIRESEDFLSPPFMPETTKQKDMTKPERAQTDPWLHATKNSKFRLKRLTFGRLTENIMMSNWWMSFCKHQGLWRPMQVHKSFWHADETFWGSTDDAMCLFYASCLHSSLNLGLEWILNSGHEKTHRTFGILPIPSILICILWKKSLPEQPYKLQLKPCRHVFWPRPMGSQGSQERSDEFNAFRDEGLGWCPTCRRAAVPPCHRAAAFSFHLALSCNRRSPCSSSACEFGWIWNWN